ncbi:2-oxoglutarate dehydrogenase complex dihydrolipoyllysine-residue succinyltransferase [Ketobacter alkanivorans]|uniref:Dihydrolipoyllysine-residue succinyltransferase component of 2-oxoglutarate dehydrogenase complex n=1 Tax=Ketobacter alkanivorans TaxID=1917421 RepID=A0A2K9LG89_9GAMM|nr:2-oxoglutarate dehydrogenase complex dihydrolipoyllysine-residue succinyltransferase [Ketobacter alkanivorans]AUM11263.1 dihydrolipoyllysine-residue succinyltransferase [Ketobacter alkanivorans]
MTTEIKAPQFPEAVADGTVATWHKKPGEAISRDELLVDIETDKVVLEVVAPHDGVVGKILKNEGDTVLSQELVGYLEEGSGAAASEPAAPAQETAAPAAEADAGKVEDGWGPAVRKLISENNLDPSKIKGTGKGGRITKEDVLNHLKGGAAKAAVAESAPKTETSAAPMPAGAASGINFGDREERRVPMTRLRARVAERLLAAQHNSAMLTTFNEVNMKPVMEMRKNYKDMFEKAHGHRLGFMSFFTMAATEALKKYPSVNASIDDNDIVYHGYYDIGVAVSTERGLVVPILRDVDKMGFAEIEGKIVEYGNKAQSGKLSLEDMTGGTFTISNGGVFGSLWSTPILNPPQTAILGMHKIQERPMAVNGKVEILPMMYLALSYDHRLIDGKEAVQFLVAIKELLEDPARMLLDL